MLRNLTQQPELYGDALCICLAYFLGSYFYLENPGAKSWGDLLACSSSEHMDFVIYTLVGLGFLNAVQAAVPAFSTAAMATFIVTKSGTAA
ncbi:MAG: hypothetical protein COC19_03115 [SAR86 cluster bacterium]|uniref:Uncharacterized protein n=1 Tax=SAR86 cluster bacterium TaxID=2030880 RepID=A0A2A4MQT4_9GAMM|nr:MAG: hypothetical protein COC19_03115 [SAR86 cluster bacterium]